MYLYSLHSKKQLLRTKNTKVLLPPPTYISLENIIYKGWMLAKSSCTYTRILLYVFRTYTHTYMHTWRTKCSILKYILIST